MTNEEFIKSVSLEGEEWSDVVGYEGLYKVSSFGRVASMAKYVNNRFKNVYKEPRLMLPHNNGNPHNLYFCQKTGLIGNTIYLNLWLLHSYQIPKLVKP